MPQIYGVGLFVLRKIVMNEDIAPVPILKVRPQISTKCVDMITPSHTRTPRKSLRSSHGKLIMYWTPIIFAQYPRP